MPTITFLPMGVAFEAKVGQTILDAALSAEIPIQHSCGGFCACATCHVIVKSGSENLSPPEEDENERLEMADGREATSRLACQGRITGPITVQVVNLD